MHVNQPLTLLGGISPADFMATYWQRKPLLVRQAMPEFKALLTRPELFDLAAQNDVEFLNPILLVGNARIEAESRLTLSGTINGSHNLTVDGPKDITLNAAIGGTSRLATFSAYSAQNLTLGPLATIATVGDIKISGATRFVNNATDAAPLKPGSGSRWLIGSGNTNPFGGDTPDVIGGLLHDFRVYGLSQEQALGSVPLPVLPNSRAGLASVRSCSSAAVCSGLSVRPSCGVSALEVSACGRLSRRASCTGVSSRSWGGSAARATSPSERW